MIARKHRPENANWDHAICPACWTSRWGEGRTTRAASNPEREICCWCGGDTDAGLYVRADPARTPCQGGPGVPQLLFR